MRPALARYAFYYPVTLLRGERIAKYLDAYTRNQWRPRAELEAERLDSLRDTLTHAERHSPYYRRRFLEAGLSASRLTSFDDLRRFPRLVKSDVIVHALEMYTRRPGFFVGRKTTGGSTGQAVTILKESDALARERAAMWRGYRWAGIDIGHRQARFWGVPLRSRDRLIHRAADWISNRQRLSAFHVTDAILEEHYRAVALFQPRYFYGYVSMVLEYARYLKRKGYRPPESLRCVITTSEVLDQATRQELESLLGVRVYNEYGCGEVGSIAHECERGGMHIVAENLVVEIEDERGRPARTGEIVVTDLHNHIMPLIRYRLGDFASFSERPCICGRSLPVLEGIHGRAYDMIIDSRGRTHHPEVFMYVFEEFKRRRGGIRQFQVIQTERRELELHLVVDENFTRESERELMLLIHGATDDHFRVHFRYTDHIEREQSGKLRVVKSLVKREAV